MTFFLSCWENPTISGEIPQALPSPTLLPPSGPTFHPSLLDLSSHLMKTHPVVHQSGLACHVHGSFSFSLMIGVTVDYRRHSSRRIGLCHHNLRKKTNLFLASFPLSGTAPLLSPDMKTSRKNLVCFCHLPISVFHFSFKQGC